MENNANKDNKIYDFFILYYQATGLPYARHLKAHASELHRTAFLDKEDIRADIKEDSDEWRLQIDQGIANSKNFILVMTLEFNDRPEIKREWKIACNNGIRRFLFKKDGLDNQELIMETDEGKIDFSKWDYTPFNNECDLLTEVENGLRGKPNPPKMPLFDIVAEKLITNEGLEIKQTNESLLEIVIGQSGTSEEWLPTGTTNENEDLLNVSPYYSQDVKMTARRNYYEIASARKKYCLVEPLADDTKIDFLLKVTSNGFFHLVEPLRPHKGHHYLESIFRQIFDMLLYAIQVLKYQQIKNDQTFKVILKNVQGLELMAVEDFPLPRYFFPKSDPAPFRGEFNPSSSWKEIGLAMKKIFGEVCQEINYTPSDGAINERLNEMLRSNFYVKYNHNFIGSRKHISLPNINISEFGFEEAKK
jgi:hypothetical protein